MSVSINNQIAFYDWQLSELDASWEKYYKSNILDLYNVNSLYIGRIWGFDAKRGVLIIRFKEGKFPRLKVPLTISYPKSTIGPINNWNFSYGEFREKQVEQYSNCQPIYYLDNEKDEEYRYIGFKNISVDFLQHIENDLKNKTNSIVILGAEDPPRDYLVALKHFTKHNSSHPILSYSNGDIENWTPQNLNQIDGLSNKIIKIIEDNKYTILQGPPGTGKTFLTAEICKYYLNKDQRVCITSLTHKALMEAVIKDGLEQARKSNKIHKTNLSVDELSLVPELKNHDITKPIPVGNLLLTTYYNLSKLLMNNISEQYDILIIEEASQAFLTTITGFSCLAKKTLIIGDFMQLQPIVLKSSKAETIDKDILTIINGLRTFSVKNNKDSYRLVNTYRLTDKSASQTGVFYQNSLVSKSELKGLSVPGKYSEWFCPLGGASLVYIEKLDEGKTPKNAISIIIDLVSEIRKYHSKIEIAVLCSFKDTVYAISDSMLKVQVNMNNLEVNTVDRVQGMTVDLCIFLIPSYQTKFSYDINRFNVATSRARHGTIILAEQNITDNILLPPMVNNYLSKSKKLIVK